MHSGTRKPKYSPAVLKKAYSIIMGEIIEDTIMDLCFKIHRAVKFDYFPIDDYTVKDGKFMQNSSTSEFDQNQKLLLDAGSSAKPPAISCPHCKRKLGVHRFAPHLNQCMGEGRQTKDRNAKRYYTMYESGDEGGDSDSGKKKKKKTSKNSSVKLSKFKGKRAQIKEFLNQKCGVESTKKSKTMCNNSLKCSMHSDEQRREIRRLLLKCEPDSNVHIDVDTVDEASRSPSPGEIRLCSSPTSTISVKLDDENSTYENSTELPGITSLYL